MNSWAKSQVGELSLILMSWNLFCWTIFMSWNVLEFLFLYYVGIVWSDVELLLNYCLLVPHGMYICFDHHHDGNTVINKGPTSNHQLDRHWGKSRQPATSTTTRCSLIHGSVKQPRERSRTPETFEITWKPTFNVKKIHEKSWTAKNLGKAHGKPTNGNHQVSHLGKARMKPPSPGSPWRGPAGEAVTEVSHFRHPHVWQPSAGRDVTGLLRHGGDRTSRWLLIMLVAD